MNLHGSSFPALRKVTPGLRLFALVTTLAAFALALGACGGEDTTVTETVTTEVTVTETEAATEEASPEPQPQANPGGGEVTLEEAQAIALEHIGDGIVTDVGDEDDFGARWEIEITRTNGSEVDVYVAADGTVVNTREGD